MRQSQLFTKTRKEAPKDEVSKNAQLLIRGGFIHKEMAGVYSYLPLGLRVLNNVTQIVREEMNSIGGQELFMTALQDKAVWEKSGRWSDEVVDNWFKTKLKNETEVGLSFTHEEPLTMLMTEYVNSYRDLPFSVYQFQTKFRNEARAKSGIMRGREFVMKDLYSFSKTAEEHQVFYDQAKIAYKKVFERVGLGATTYMTYASGGTFCKYSHEFQTVTDAGEDTIYVCEKCKIAVNEEIIKDQPTCPECGNDKLEPKKAVEVGNIFSLGTRFSESFDLTYLDEKGEKQLVVMGSYGIGIGRLAGAIVEALSDEKGIVWPEEVSPFAVHLISLSGKNPTTKDYAEQLYKLLKEKGIEVLFDDRELRPGEKFADADLLGIAHRVVVSDKTVEQSKVEYKKRTDSEAILITEEELQTILHHV